MDAFYQPVNPRIDTSGGTVSEDVQDFNYLGSRVDNIENDVNKTDTDMSGLQLHDENM